MLEDPIKGFGVLSDYARRKVTHVTGVGKASFTKAHPALKEYTEIFEERASDLSAMVDKLLRKYGKNIVGKQFETRRLADIMIDLFVLSTVISRVTGLVEAKGAEACKTELEILHVFAGQVNRRVRSNFSKIDANDDAEIASLADDALNNEKYRWDTL